MMTSEQTHAILTHAPKDALDAPMKVTRCVGSVSETYEAPARTLVALGLIGDTAADHLTRPRDRHRVIVNGEGRWVS